MVRVGTVLAVFPVSIYFRRQLCILFLCSFSRIVLKSDQQRIQYIWEKIVPYSSC